MPPYGRGASREMERRERGERVDMARNVEEQEVVLPVVEEQLHIGKREVETGGVRVSQRVEERPVEQQVTLRDERVAVERVPVDQPIDTATLSEEGLDEAFRPVTVEVHEYDEAPVVEREARVVEEVVIGKDVEQRTETVQDTIRRTDVEVQETPGAVRQRLS